VKLLRGQLLHFVLIGVAIYLLFGAAAEFGKQDGVELATLVKRGG